MGGKKKSKRVVQKAARDVLAKQFTCLFCNHEGAVTVKMKRDDAIGDLSCRVCNVAWQCKITPQLDEPIDVYAAWVDASELAQEKAQKDAKSGFYGDGHQQSQQSVAMQRSQLPPSRASVVRQQQPVQQQRSPVRKPRQQESDDNDELEDFVVASDSEEEQEEDEEEAVTTESEADDTDNEQAADDGPVITKESAEPVVDVKRKRAVIESDSEDED